ncbi:isoprenoid biosynthesis glyoxalase ElbB [candidate division GN15 bacterium]|nr:isoprenoid biosynthesis glyoxalase ElbB [candidate division GN15 bacterium]
MKKVAVVLSGCGVYDGAEVHESVLTLLYLDQAGATVQCFAPDKPQMHVVNHLTGEPVEGETRNVLTEAARIARGDIKPLTDLSMDDFDAVVFPGGFGAAKNLCTFAVDGPDCKIEGDVERVTRDAINKKKVVGTICISPACTAKALSGVSDGAKLTIGTDQGTMDGLTALKAAPVAAEVTDIVVDEEKKIVSTPAYMLGQRINDVATGIEKLVKRVIEMA